MTDVILSPVISERSMQLVKVNKFTFRVSMDANKNKIRKAIKDKFGVDVIKVTTSITKKRKKLNMQKRQIVEPSFKKAIVKIKDGQKIDLFEVKTK